MFRQQKRQMYHRWRPQRHQAREHNTLYTCCEHVNVRGYGVGHELLNRLVSEIASKLPLANTQRDTQTDTDTLTNNKGRLKLAAARAIGNRSMFYIRKVSTHYLAYTLCMLCFSIQKPNIATEAVHYCILGTACHPPLRSRSRPCLFPIINRRRNR